MAIAPAAASPFRLARLDRTRNAFVAPESCAAERCTSADARLHFDAFHDAEPAPVLRELRVQALFDATGAAEIPYGVWHYRAERPHGNSGGVSFVAGRESMRRLALDYRIGEAAQALHAKCALTTLDASLLEPGQYVLAGPRSDGGGADLDRFIYSGTPRRPLLAADGELRAFDYLAFRIEALV